MLTKVRLRNFRCFDDHTIPLRKRTLIIGRNNAGKSTVVESLRLVSLVANRMQNFQLHAPPRWLEIPKALHKNYRGVIPSLEGWGFNFETLFHRYGDPPARVTASFSTHRHLDLYIGPSYQVYGVLLDSHGNIVRPERGKPALPRVSILPQIGPLNVEERRLTPEYVKGAVSSHLASLHFRNQIALFPENWAPFCDIAEHTWPGLRIQELLRDRRGRVADPLQLMIRDGDFVAEVGRMGHGLQMWLQTMWFLARSEGDATVILDEPDVYMHADLQRRLVRLLPGRHRQVVIATHSVEMLAEVGPDEVLIIDRSRPESHFAASIPAVQRLVDRIGGVHNVQLARLWNSRRVLLVEGDDVALLRILHDKLYPKAIEPLDAIPRVPLGGWSGFPYAIGARLLLRNAGGEEIIPYCLLDSDYHTCDEIDERYAAAARSGVQLHVWQKKELENYLLVPSAVRRAMSLNTGRPDEVLPSPDEIADELDRLATGLKEATTDSLATELLNRNRAAGLANANALARAHVQEAWQTRGGSWGIVSGKAMLSGLSGWSQERYGFSLSTGAVARALLPTELADEIIHVLSAIERCERFDNNRLPD